MIINTKFSIDDKISFYGEDRSTKTDRFIQGVVIAIKTETRGRNTEVTYQVKSNLPIGYNIHFIDEYCATRFAFSGSIDDITNELCKAFEEVGETFEELASNVDRYSAAVFTDMLSIYYDAIRHCLDKINNSSWITRWWWNRKLTKVMGSLNAFMDEFAEQNENSPS